MGLPRLKSRFALDVYVTAGITVLVIASAVLVFLLVNSWDIIARGSRGGHYLIAVLIASMVPLAMLLLYIFSSIKGRNTRHRSSGEDVSSNIALEPEEQKPGELVTPTAVNSAVREVEVTKNTNPNSEEKKPMDQARLLEEAVSTASDTVKINIEGVVREEVAKAAAGLLSKIDVFSQEIQGVRKELDEIKNTVENTMIDIRNLLSEISNPFNYMRRFATESDIKELGLSVNREGDVDKKEKAEREASGSLEMSGKASEYRANGSNSAPPMGSSEDSEAEKLGRELVEILSSHASVSRLMRMIMFVGDNLPILGREGLLSVVELGVSSGAIPKESIDVVVRTISLIENTRVSPKRLAVTLHKLAKSLGINDREAEFLAMALSEG